MTRLRALSLAGAVAVVTAVVAATAIGGETAKRPTGAGAVLPAAAADGRPALLFRGDTGTADGRVVAGPLDAPDAAETSSLRCDRVYYAARRGLCMTESAGATGTQVAVFDDELRVEHRLDVEGLTSRARVSPDGRTGAVTTYVTGHQYTDPGEFSTSTTLIDLETGRPIAGLEEFRSYHRGALVTAIDVNYWGVTFAADGDTFYASLATGGKTYLVRGSLAKREMHTLRANVECPSLSPDGTRIAFKKRVDDETSIPWRLTVLDLETMRETRLPEDRGFDDQAEWVDDDRIAYGLDGDVYAIDADGRGRPELLRADAASPSVARF